MQFIYANHLGSETLEIKDDIFMYLSKVRRVKIGNQISFRDENDTQKLYTYQIENITKKSMFLKLLKSDININVPNKYIHIIWAIVDISTIEKTLPFLNEIGVSKISFFYSQFSQQNFKINQDRIKNILKNSSQQCGRSDFINIEILKDLDEVLAKYQNASVLDFGGKSIESSNFNMIDFNNGVIVGCEGGFSDKEKERLHKHVCFKIESNTILTSKSAVCFIASIALLQG